MIRYKYKVEESKNYPLRDGYLNDLGHAGWKLISVVAMSPVYTYTFIKKIFED